MFWHGRCSKYGQLGIYRGRPFGGVAICWSHDLNNYVIPLVNYKHKRVISKELKTDTRNIIVITAYMPFFIASRREQCMSETLYAISMTDLIIDEHPHHDFVIGDDLNTELKGESPFDSLWLELISKHSFAYCDNLVSSPGNTYRHDSLNQTKFDDHFLISQSIYDQNLTHGHQILDNGDNHSDHLPLLLKMKLQVHSFQSSSDSSPNSARIKWRKLSSVSKAVYTQKLDELLRQREFPLYVSARPLLLYNLYICQPTNQLMNKLLLSHKSSLKTCLLFKSRPIWILWANLFWEYVQIKLCWLCLLYPKCASTFDDFCS